MRPLTLTLEGFRSHEERTVIELEGRNLIAIVGPTGSGKSSILDALCYALYAKTSRFAGGSKGLRSLICSRSDAAAVRLRFTVDETNWVVTRSLPRRTAGQHLLEDEGSGDKHIGAAEVNSRIEELLGLDFDAFCSSVLLAQGQFARFLEAGTTDRMKILKGVFRYDQIDELRATAVRRRADLQRELDKIEGERRQIPEDARAQLAEARKEEKEWSEFSTRLHKAVPEEKRLAKQIEKSESIERDARSRRVRMDEDVRRIPAPEEFEALFAREATIEKALGEARERAAQASADLKSAQSELRTLEKRLGAEAELRDVRGEAKNLWDVAREIDELDNEIADRRESLERLKAAAATKESEEAKKLGHLDEARAQLRSIEQAHAAHALRGDLKKGEPCPVCEQEVEKLPRGKAPAALKTVRDALAKAEKAHKKSTEAATKARGEAEQARTLLDVARKGVAEKTKRFKALDATLRASVGRVKNPLEEIDERLAQLDKVKGRVAEASKLVERVRSDLDAATAQQNEFASQRQRVAAALIAVAGKLDLEVPEVDAPVEKLEGHAETAREALRSAMAEAEAAMKEAEESRAEATGALEELRESLELDSSQTITDALGDAKTQVGMARKKITELEKKIERAKELDHTERELRGRKDIFDQLADDLRNETFINFLLEDRRRLLSDLGSERLREMTGRYRFDDAGEFDIIDELDADKKRSVETLSGGETFLASLALAIALAETVARHGGRLQCFFIDEGFGSLDPESLDLALDGIERIVGPDRLIGVVSHVAELGRRVEDKIVLDKSPEGTTIVVSGAA